MSTILSWRSYALPVFIFCFPAAASQTNGVYTLEDCLRIGLERSAPLRNAERDLEIARQNVQQVRALAKPSLTLNANYTRLDDTVSFPGVAEPIGSPDTYAATLDAEQLLYSGGAVRAALRIAVDYLEAAEQRRRRVEHEVARNITRGFYDVLYREREAAVAVDSLAQRERFEAQVRAQYESETRSEFEWISAQVDLANERPKSISARNALVLARRAYRDLVYIEETEYRLNGTLDVEPAEWRWEDLVEHALRERPELREATANIDVSRNESKVVRGDSLPEVKAFATYGGADPSQRNPFGEGWEWEWVAGVRLTWSLWDGGARRAERRVIHEQIAQAEDRLGDMECAVVLELETAWLSLEEARETLRGTGDNVRLAERALAIASVRYEQGLSTNLEFTDSHLALNQAQLNHSRALLAYQHAQIDIRYAAGLPVREEHR